MTKEVQRIHLNQDSIVTINNYDDFGRLESINRNNEITTYNYDSGNKSRVNSISIAGKNTQTFGFDALDRLTKISEDITANGTTKTFVSSMEYDAIGRIKKELYPSGYYTIKTYDRYSNLLETKDQYNRSIWKANTENALGQATSIFKGAKETTYDYDPTNHQMTSVYASGIIDYTYGYYAADGTSHANNLEWRIDNLNPQNIQQEYFTYDAQNRLTNWDVTRNGTTTCNSLHFDDKGNIESKSDLGNFTLSYGGQRTDGSAIGPHALTGISGIPSSSFPQTDLAVIYTDFKKIKTLTEGSKQYELTYGVDDQRRATVYKVNGVSKLTRYYLGNYEEEVLPNGNMRKIHYLGSAILIQNSNSSTDSLLYSYSDAQGSLIALTDQNGNILSRTVNGITTEVGRFAYDPWGARRNPENWTEKDTRTSFLLNRGYTGHEHLDAFGIINMNACVK